MNKIEDENDDTEDDGIKAILVGETATGKTSLINTAIGLEFKEKVESTQASTIMEKKIVINNKTYTINMWDTIGQEKYRAVTKIFMKDARIVIVVYDITRSETFEELDFWFNNIKEVLGDKPVVGLIGNKSDLYEEEQVTEETGKEYANKKGVPFALTTAKVPANFCHFLELLLEKYLNKLPYLDTNSDLFKGNKAKLDKKKGGKSQQKAKKFC